MKYSHLAKTTVTAFRLHAGQQTGKNVESFAVELKQIFDPIGAPTLSDRLVLARWRTRNSPNYMMRAARLALLGRGLHFPRFSSQL